MDVETQWCINPAIFSKFTGSVIAYGINDDGSDWICELFVYDGKFYADPIAYVECPEEYISTNKIKAVATNLREKVREKLNSSTK